jgi:hypothetical protein
MMTTRTKKTSTTKMRSNGCTAGVQASPVPSLRGEGAGVFHPAAEVEWKAKSVSPLENEDDQDTGDVPGGVDEDALDRDELDTDRITSTEDVDLLAGAARQKTGPWFAHAGGAARPGFIGQLERE